MEKNIIINENKYNNKNKIFKRSMDNKDMYEG